MFYPYLAHRGHSVNKPVRLSSTLNTLLQSALGVFDLELGKKGTIFMYTLEMAHIAERPKGMWGSPKARG